MKVSRVILALGFLLTTVSVASAQTIKDPETGKTFSASQTVWGKTWVALGVGARERYTINVYAIAFFVEKEGGSEALKKWLAGDGSSYASGGKLDISKAQGTQKFYNTLLNCSCGRGVEIKLARSVSGADIKDAFIGSLEKSIGDLNAADVAADVKRLEDFLNYDVKDGSTFKFYVSKGGSLAATGPGGELIIKNSKLAKGFLGIWLGPSAINKNLKQNLVANANVLLE